MGMDNAWLMALDLSAPRGVLALDGPGGTLQREVAGASRVSRLFVAAGELMSEAQISPRDLGLLGVGRGPGSFTGVRVAVTAAKVLASVLAVPLVAPDSLMVNAAGVGKEARAVFAAIDARRGEVYHALYRLENGYPRVLVEARVGPPAEAALSLAAWMEEEGGGVVGVGSGIDEYGGVWPEGMERATGEYPRAEALAELCRLAYGRGEMVDPVALLPLYIRRPDARERSAGEKGAGYC